MYTLLTLFAIVAAVSCNDLLVGTEGGRKIFDEKREATPAIWKQVQNVTVNATDNEVISRVVVTDLRPNKDGEVKIVEGGEGQKNVTLELKSPTVLRGFDFKIEVYSSTARKNRDTPTMDGDTDVNEDAEETDEDVTSTTEIEVTGTDIIETPVEDSDQVKRQTQDPQSPIVEGMPQESSGELPQNPEVQVPQDQAGQIPDETAGLPQDQAGQIPQDQAAGLPQGQETVLPQDEASGLPQGLETVLPQDPIVQYVNDKNVSNETPVQASLVPELMIKENSEANDTSVIVERSAYEDKETTTEPPTEPPTEPTETTTEEVPETTEKEKHHHYHHHHGW